MAEYRNDEELKKAHAKATKRFYLVVVLLFLMLVFLVASVVLWVITPRPEKEPDTDGGLFSVESVVLEGNTKYLEESVIGESGILIGQSIFSVKSNAIEETLLATFPYYEAVEVQTRHMKEVCITVTETAEVGVLYDGGDWIPIGENGKALDRRPISSDRPRGMLYIKGATPPEGGVVVGGDAMDAYSTSLLQTLLTAINRYELTDIIEIDMSNHSDLRMNWRGQIEIRLGNATNLDHEIAVVASTIPSILEMRGEQITGILNVSSYSNEALDKQAVFTPSSLLDSNDPAVRKPIDGEGADPEDNGGTIDHEDENGEEGID